MCWFNVVLSNHALNENKLSLNEVEYCAPKEKEVVLVSIIEKVAVEELSTVNWDIV